MRMLRSWVERFRRPGARCRAARRKSARAPRSIPRLLGDRLLLRIGDAALQRVAEQSERVQRLAQVVARRCEEARLHAVRLLGFLARRFGLRFLLRQLLDERDVLVAAPHRLDDRAIELAPEQEDAVHYQGADDREQNADCSALDRELHDDRHQHRQDECIKRGQVAADQRNRGRGQGEQRDEKQRLVLGRSGHVHEESRAAPDAAVDRRAERPVALPGADAMRQIGGAPKGEVQTQAPEQHRADRGEPQRECAMRDLSPHPPGHGDRAGQNAERRARNVAVDRCDQIGAHRDLARQQTAGGRWRGEGGRGHCAQASSTRFVSARRPSPGSANRVSTPSGSRRRPPRCGSIRSARAGWR